MYNNLFQSLVTIKQEQDLNKSKIDFVNILQDFLNYLESETKNERLRDYCKIGRAHV